MLLSIITINLNNLAGLRKTAESIIGQTSADYEWIVIDGGSNDGSADYMRSIDSSISYWVSEKDSGVYNAMNKGIKRATGEYLLFLNSGDCFYDNNVVADFGVEVQPDDQMVYADAVEVDGEGHVLRMLKSPARLTLSYFWGHTLCHQAVFYRRTLFDTYRYNEQNRIASDIESYIYFAYQGMRLRKWDRVTTMFECGGLSSQKSADEFQSIVRRNLSPYVLADYTDLIKLRDVDLLRMQMDIVNSSRVVRHLTRILYYPYYYTLKALKLLKKS